MDSLSTLPTKARQSPPLSPAKTLRIQLPTPWQRKWLDLECYHPAIVRTAGQVELFCGRFAKNNPQTRTLVLAGNPGCGKTHMAKAIYKWARAFCSYAFHDIGKWNEFPRVSFLQWGEHVDEYSRTKGAVPDDWLGDHLLIIDDVGAENDSFKIGTARLSQVMNHRTSRRFTVITTNVQPAAWGEVFDARVADRFLRDSVVCDMFEIPSYAFVRHVQ